MKISVIIPTYNRAGLIEQTIDSVLAQSFHDYEVIVIDDGSTDETAEKLAAYGGRIRYVRQQNGGVNRARNHALSLARGEYIATLDDDDLWQTYKLATQVQILERFPELACTYSNFAIYRSEQDIEYDGIQSWFPGSEQWHNIFDTSIEVGELGIELSDHIDPASRLYSGSIYHASLAHYYVLPSSALFRRSMIPDGVRFIEHDPICGDWDFFARLSRDHPVAYLDHETTFNRSHEDQVRLTRTAWKKQLECRVDMLERLYMRDEDFYTRHHEEVNAVYYDNLMSLCRQQLLDDEPRAARSSLKRLSGQPTSKKPACLAMYGASYVPGIGPALRILRHLRG